MSKAYPTTYFGPNSAVIQGQTKREAIKTSHIEYLEDWR